MEKQSACFVPKKNIADPGASGQGYGTEDVYFTATEVFLTNLDGTEDSLSPDFDLLDILPGLIYPEVFVHVSINEVQSEL